MAKRITHYHTFTIGETVQLFTKGVHVSRPSTDGAHVTVEVYNSMEKAHAVMNGSVATITALSCIECGSECDARCCGAAWCTAHGDAHRNVEHRAPECGRYRAMAEGGYVRRVGDQPRIPGLPRNRKCGLTTYYTLSDARCLADGIRIWTGVGGSLYDPIGDALRQVAAGQARLVTPSAAHKLSADMYARIVIPETIGLVGETKLAGALRECNTNPRNKNLGELSRRLYRIGDSFPYTPRREDSPIIRAVAGDSLHILEWTKHCPFPFVATDVLTPILRHVLASDTGPEDVGKAIARIWGQVHTETTRRIITTESLRRVS